MAEKGNSAEFRAFVHKLEELEADVVTCQELNRAWHRLPETDRLRERFRGAFESVHLCESRYENDVFAVGSKQYGGTMVMGINSACHSVHNNNMRDYDKKGLGRWSATRFAGKYGKGVRVVSAYRPNPASQGELTVFAQHSARLAELDDDREPLHAFADDFDAALESWREAGDTIIVGMDLNGDVREKETEEFFAQHSMREVLIERHGHHGPETYADGSVPIDGIFATSNAEIIGGGYLEFGSFADTDHRGLWVDFARDEIFGTRQVTPRISANRLLHGHPKVEEKYTKTLEGQLRRHKCLTRARNLRQRATYPARPEDNAEWEQLDRIMVEARRCAERKCRKLKMGGVDWTPEVSKAQAKIALCRCMARRRLYRKVSSRLIERLCRYVGDFSIHEKDLLEIRRLEKEAMAEWKELKNEEGRRAKFIERLAVAKAEKNKTKAVTELRKMQQEEEQRSAGRRIRTITGRQRRRRATVFRRAST